MASNGFIQFSEEVQREVKKDDVCLPYVLALIIADPGKPLKSYVRPNLTNKQKLGHCIDLLSAAGYLRKSEALANNARRYFSTPKTEALQAKYPGLLG